MEYITFLHFILQNKTFFKTIDFKELSLYAALRKLMTSKAVFAEAIKIF